MSTSGKKNTIRKSAPRPKGEQTPRWLVGRHCFLFLFFSLFCFLKRKWRARRKNDVFRSVETDRCSKKTLFVFTLFYSHNYLPPSFYKKSPRCSPSRSLHAQWRAPLSSRGTARWPPRPRSPSPRSAPLSPTTVSPSSSPAHRRRHRRAAVSSLSRSAKVRKRRIGSSDQTMAFFVILFVLLDANKCICWNAKQRIVG